MMNNMANNYGDGHSLTVDQFNGIMGIGEEEPEAGPSTQVTFNESTSYSDGTQGQTKN